MLFCFLSDSLDTQGSFQHPYVPSNSQSCPLTVSQHPPKKEKKKAFCELIFSLTHSAYKAPYYILLWPSKLQRRVGHWGASALCSPEFFTLSLALPLRKIISRMKESDRAPGWLWIPVSMTGEATRGPLLSRPGLRALLAGGAHIYSLCLTHRGEAGQAWPENPQTSSFEHVPIKTPWLSFPFAISF